MRIALASSSPVGIPILEALAEGDHEIVFVITNPDKETGRGQKISANAFSQAAADRSIPVEKPKSHEEITGILSSYPVDLVVTVAYGRLIKKEALSIPPRGWINIHFSQLPRWRGAAPVQYSLLSGDKNTGISIFQLDEGMDTGPLFFCKSFDIGADDTTSTLLLRLSTDAAKSINAVLDEILQGAQPTPQSSEGATLAPKFTKEDGRLDFRREAQTLINKIRALGEKPGTYLTFRNERLNVARARVVNELSFSGDYGTFYATKSALYVKASDAWIELLEVKPAGKKAMSGSEFARGARIGEGERCE